MASQIIYRKINIFYADDLSKNVRNLLEGLEQSGLILKTAKKRKELILNLPDLKEHYTYNISILQSDLCLINLDYSTKIDDSVQKIKRNKGNYDLIICDLYFGDNDEDYCDSKIGGIWIVFWAKHLSKDRNIECKLYSGQLATVINHVDYQRAFEFIQQAYNIEVEEIEKSKDAGSWKEHLLKYLDDVRMNIIPEIELNDRVDFINYLASHFHYEHFHNKKENGKLDDFRKSLSALEKTEFNLIDGRKMKLIHLFPIILGSHFTTDDEQNFKIMDLNLLEDTLYKKELIFDSWEELEKKINDFQREGIQCEEIEKYDETGRPIYGIRFLEGKYYLGVISKIENSFIHSLDWTYQIHKFYTLQQGFGYWSSSSPMSPLSENEFNRIRNDIILPSFQRIEKCFEQLCPKSNNDQKTLADQIEYALRNINESYFWEKNGHEEQKIEHGFQKLKTQALFNNEKKDTILHLKALFRINVPYFFKIVLHFKEGKDYEKYEDNEFQRNISPEFYWYCNAYVVREGLKDLKANMQDDNLLFYMLESRDKNNELIKYKIILRDFGRGIPSIIRKFNLKESCQTHKFIQFLKGFCQLTIRSKMADFEGIFLSVFTVKDEIPYPQMLENGTEYEIMFTQKRDR